MQAGARGSPDVAETPKPNDTRLASSRLVVVGNNTLAADEALRDLLLQGYQGHVHTVSLVGDVEQAAQQVVELARHELAAATLDARGGSTGLGRCVILAGETTVKFGHGADAGAASGKGGRCSHMALLVSRALSGVPNWCVRAFPSVLVATCAHALDACRPMLPSCDYCGVALLRCSTLCMTGDGWRQVSCDSGHRRARRAYRRCRCVWRRWHLAARTCCRARA